MLQGLVKGCDVCVLSPFRRGSRITRRLRLTNMRSTRTHTRIVIETFTGTAQVGVVGVGLRVTVGVVAVFVERGVWVNGTVVKEQAVPGG